MIFWRYLSAWAYGSFRDKDKDPASVWPGCLSQTPMLKLNWLYLSARLIFWCQMPHPFLWSADLYQGSDSGAAMYNMKRSGPVSGIGSRSWLTGRNAPYWNITVPWAREYNTCVTSWNSEVRTIEVHTCSRNRCLLQSVAGEVDLALKGTYGMVKRNIMTGPHGDQVPKGLSVGTDFEITKRRLSRNWQLYGPGYICAPRLFFCSKKIQQDRTAAASFYPG